VGKGVCTCEDEGWFGPACDKGCPRNAETTAICSDHGECIYQGGETICECDAGYNGDSCFIFGDFDGSLTDEQISVESSLVVNFIWGVSGVDMSNHDPNDPDSKGVPIYDEQFDLADPEAQAWLADQCESWALGSLPLFRKDHIDCFMTPFKASVSNNWPLPREDFAGKLHQWLQTSHGKDYQDNIAFAGERVAWVTVNVVTYTNRKQGSVDLLPMYDIVDDLMADLNDMSPESMREGRQSASEWPRVIVEVAFVDGLKGSLSIALGSAFFSIIIFTGNLWLSFIASLLMIFIVVCMLGFFVVKDWTLGAVEAISLGIVVGLSVDYSLHLSHAYVDQEINKDVLAKSSISQRYVRTRGAVREIGSSIFAAAATTIVSMLPLFFTKIRPFEIIGTIVAMTSFLAILFTMGFKVALLTLVGPEEEQGDVSTLLGINYLRKRFGRNDEPKQHTQYIIFKNDNGPKFFFPRNSESVEGGDHMYDVANKIIRAPKSNRIHAAESEDPKRKIHAIQMEEVKTTNKDSGEFKFDLSLTADSSKYESQHERHDYY